MRQYKSVHSSHYNTLRLAAASLFAGCMLLVLVNAPVFIADTSLLPISPAAFIAFAAACAVAVWASSDNRPSLKQLAVLLALSITWVAIAVLNGALDLSQAGVTTRVAMHNHVLFMAVLISFTLALSDHDTHNIAGKLVVTAVLVNTVLILFEATTRLSLSPDTLAMVESQSRFRSAGLFKQPNVSAKFLVLGLACSVATLPKRWALPYFIFVALAVFLTGSRSNMLLTALVFVLASRHLLGSRSVITLIYAGTVAAISYAAITTNVTSELENVVGDDVAENITRIVERVQSGFDDVEESRDSRIEASRQAWKTLLDHPLGGSGVTQFATLTNQLDLTPHNSYATQGVLFGFPGLLWLATLTALVALRARWRSMIFMSCFLASCLFSGENLQDLFIAVFLAWTFAMPRQRRWHHAGLRPRTMQRPFQTLPHQSQSTRSENANEPVRSKAKTRRRRRRRRSAIDSLGNEDLENLDI